MPVTIDSSNIIIDRGASNVYVDIVKTKGYIKKNNVAICIPELEEEYSYNDSIYNYNIFTYNKDIYPSLNIDNSNLIVHWKFDNHNLFHNYSKNPASINVNQRNISNIYSNGVIDLNNKYIGVGSLFKSDQNDIYGYNITPANWMSELLEKEATFTFWIKQTYSSSTNIVQTIFSHDSTFAIKQENGNFRVYIATGNYSYYDNVASFLFTYNTWVHIAIVINLNANTNINNVINIYRNGELLNSTLNTYDNTYSGIIGSGFPNNNNIFRFLSGSETNLNSGFKGNLDDFRIYNKCLSGTEIYDLYNNYKSKKYNIKFENDTYCDMLIVAGGGGGSRRMGGGGGAGALIFDNFTFRKNKEYILKIGKGGLGVDTPGNIGGEITTSMKTGENGGDSEIINDDICIYRAAGGGGGQGGGTLAGQNAASGGSGGGSGGKDYLHGGLLSNNNIVNGNSISVYRNYYDSGDAPKYNSSKVFGNEGGIGNGDNPRGGGGGGGAGSRGFDSFDQNPNNNNIIKGGDGIHSVDNIDFKSFFSIKNTNIGHHYSDKVYFSGGGGGGNWDGSIYYNDGGLGGGGRSGMSSTLRLPNINGMLNTGGGGGGEGKDEYGGGHGGSGVIILKYKLNKIDSSQEYDAQWKYKRNTSNVYFMGNVGIGTKSNPEYSLNVQGDINITGDLYKNGALIEYPKYLVKTDDVEISPILDLSLYKDSIDENFTSTPSILYKYHILTYEGSSGYTSTTDGNQRTYNIDFPEDAVADILVVGGGGAGGTEYIGAGGGAGGLVYDKGIELSGTYTIKVGRGGVALSTGNEEDGRASSIIKDNVEIYTGYGGGNGGTYYHPDGASGGSGGGTTWTGGRTQDNNQAIITYSGGSATKGFPIDKSYGYKGAVYYNTSGLFYAGGGGGAGSEGYRIAGKYGWGGDGKQIDITGENKYYAAGGGGGSDYAGYAAQGGSGIGGNGASGNEDPNIAPTNGQPMTGSGGGGGGGGAGGAAGDGGGSGGSGIVIIRYYTIHKLINNDILTPYGDIYKYSIISKYKYLVLTYDGPYPKLPFDDTNLLIWYKFDSELVNGSVKDSGILQNHLDIYGTNIGIDNVDYVINSSYKSDGNDGDYLMMSKNLNLYQYQTTTGISFSLWFKITQNASSINYYGSLFWFQDSTSYNKWIHVRIYNAGRNDFILSIDNYLTTNYHQIRPLWALNVWTHLVWTIDNTGRWKYYINGNDMGLNKTMSMNNSVFDKCYLFSGENYNGAQGAAVKMDDFRIYNKVLSQTDVSTLYTDINISNTSYQVNFPENTTCDILVVAGGGCGADASWTGGGGAGGLIYYRKQLQGTYTIKVGKGGGPQDTTEDQQSTINSGKNGRNSEILDSEGNVLFRAIGGSMGTRQVETGVQQQVFEGGSTGGSGYRNTYPLYSGVGNLSSQNIINGSNVSIINAGGTESNTDRYDNTSYGVDEYGNQYGMFGHRGGSYPSGTLHRGCGGGGAGGVGINGDALLTNSSDGGAGKDMSSIFGTNVGENGWFAGGGGGSGLYDLGVGGMGGGGDGKKDVKGEDGMAGTGGGGGAYTRDAVTTYFTGGNGGSGIVIIRHLSKYISGVEFLSQWNYNYIGNVYNLGNVGIGTTNPKTELDVIGDITGNTKNFKINHPLISNKWLYHGTIEAPRYENLYRGRKIIKNGKCFINIDKECNSTGGMSVGTFLALNSNCDLYLQNNTTYDRVIGYIENGIIKVQCENINDEIEIDWLVISERKDGSLINTPSTNYQGKMICEHKIEDSLN